MFTIGITGTLGAGKGTVVEYLTKQFGFNHYSVRDFIIKEIIKRDITINRDNMVLVANELREAYGAGYIAEELYRQATMSGGNSIIESIRTVGEIESLKKLGPFCLFAVDADPEKRYKRAFRRKSETDKISLPQFLADEKREMESDDPTKQNLSACIKLADYVFSNNGTIPELREQVLWVMRKAREFQHVSNG
jgi:dephospho-CoA kinase